MKESKSLGMQGCCNKFIGNGRHHQPPSPLQAPQGLSDTPLTEALRNLSVRGHLHSRESPCGCSQEARCNGGDARGRDQMGDVGMRTSDSIDPPNTRWSHLQYFPEEKKCSSDCLRKSFRGLCITVSLEMK